MEPESGGHAHPGLPTKTLSLMLAKDMSIISTTLFRFEPRAHTRAHTHTHTLHTQHNTTQHIHTHTQGSVPAVTEFAKFALQVLKCLPSTALVEARFSLTTMMKSKHRSLLDIKKLRGMLLMKDELPFESEQLSFVELWSRMKPWLAKQGLIKPIKSRRSAYKVAKARKQLHELHGVSSEYV